MKIRNLTAAMVAAAVLAIAAPMTGVLPGVSVVASAEELKEGDIFYAGIDENGNFNGNIGEADKWGHDVDGVDAYHCTVKSDGTIKIAYTKINIASGIPALEGKTLTIPSSINGYTVSEIGYYEDMETFSNFASSGCKKAVIPDTVKTIGIKAFSQSFCLEEVEFGSDSQLELILQEAFRDCRFLKSITIPASVETIDVAAFANTDLGESFLFSDTFSLTTVNFAEGSKLKVIGEAAFQLQKSIETIELPDSLEKIAAGAFYECTGLTSITIPESVNTIEEEAFHNCSLTNINGEPGSYAETYANENGYTFNAAASDKEDEPDDTSKPEEDNDTSKPDDTSKPEKSDDTSKPEATEERFWYHRDLDMEDVEVGGTFPLDVEVDAKLDESSTDKRMVYDIRLIRDGKDYEPDGTVAVRIRVPDSMSDIADNLKVYHLKDGKYTNMNAESDQRGWLEFNTDHFSVYVLTAEELENADGSDSTSTPDKSEPDKGSPDTGVPAAAAAVGVLALAGAVVMISRKKR